MSFWLFMLFSNLLIPLSMIGFGRYFVKHPPKHINSLLGYRTSMSMKNEDTWTFAHHYCGKLWYKLGLITLAVSLVAMFAAAGSEKDTVSAVGVILCLVQLTVMLLSIIPTEKALKRTFDKNGDRR